MNIQSVTSAPMESHFISRKEEVNAFTLNGTGLVHEGIHIELESKIHKKKLVLVIGGSYVPMDSQNPCEMYKMNNVGLVRRMTVETLDLHNRPAIELLKKPTVSDTAMYLVINPVVRLAPGAKPNTRFWCGVVCESAHIIRKDEFSGEAFVAFRKDGDSASVFYTNGQVVTVSRSGASLKVTELTIEEQAQKRIQHALENIRIAQATIKDEEALARRTDVFYHMIVEVLKVGGKRSEQVFDMVFELLNAAGKQGQLRPGVQLHVREVLSRLNPAAALQFNLNCQRFDAKKQSGGAFGNVSLPSLVAGPKGPPPSARAKQAKRSARDREERDRRRGSSQEIPLHQNGGRNFKKK